MNTLFRYTKAALLTTVLASLQGCSHSNLDNNAKTTDALTSDAIKENTAITVIANIADFDSNIDNYTLTTMNAQSRIVGDDASNKELQVLYSPQSAKSAVDIEFKQPLNWQDFKEYHLAIDVHNTGTESVQLYLGITNNNGQTATQPWSTSNRSINVAAGESATYFAVLDGSFSETYPGLRESPKPWQTNEDMFIWRYGHKEMTFNKITKISLFTRGNLNPKSVIVDNIRLRKNPEYNKSYLANLVDEFGQNAQLDYPIKVNSISELQAVAKQELADLGDGDLMADRSRFGGWKNGPRLEATGYFRTTKVEGQWWMVDPEGYLFFSHGVANVRMANLFTLTGVDFKNPEARYVDPNETTPEDSIGIVTLSDNIRSSRYVSSSIRHDMFTWLPEYDHPLADHYSYRRKVHMGPMTSGETYSFYRANVERRYGETQPQSYLKKWQEVTLKRMRNWGFTSMGNWVDPAFYPNQQVPYFANGWIIGDFATISSGMDIWAPLPDPFDPEFVRRTQITIDVIADEIQGSPWCAGIFIDNEKSWGLREGSIEQRYGAVLNVLAKTLDKSPAKHAFIKQLKQQYKQIETLNTAWQTKFSAWQQLNGSVKLNTYTAQAESDFSQLLELLSNEYFRVVHDTLAKTLPEHLYMGVRMASWGMPKETVSAAVKYSDVLSFNIYQEGVQPLAWEFLKDIDLPSIIGEFHIGATSDSGVFHPGLVQAADQHDRARMYTDYMQSVARHPNMVGAHWFQYVDSPITGRAFDGENYNVGFVSVTDIPYQPMVDAAKAFNRNIYPKRFSKKIGQ
ncbi:beta-galactosidase [Paraglaciecola arctica]|uniref:beta-galactosidase n=1 Tax=Paraglaciecola arctica TaxID=1128911 RepID=UPI001C066495|nr:beta-galactosidase [Paraglaciecola arctica]MBU3005409.1 beta-galactosidase [Paraglaciecola arctica]